ncbi:MAG: glycosyltransferase, partial [Candidatus Eisenbacteria bacterium]|nr:glycosyltransferase [Candidatus Eisenbacteria bacterium]
SPDDTPQFLASYDGPLTLRTVRQPANRGRAAARNAGLRVASGELIIFLDDDMQVVPGFVRAHIEHHRMAGSRTNAHSHAEVASATTAAAIGNVTNAPEITDSPIIRYMSTRGAQKIREGGSLPWRYFSTNNSSVRLADIEAVGFFDEEFRTYGFEDLELGYRLHRRGLTFGFVPAAESLHIHYHDLDDVLNKKELSGGRSLDLFIRKHPDAWREIPMSRWDNPGANLILNPVFYALLKPLARFDAGPISDRIFDYLVLYRTLRGLKKARA